MTLKYRLHESREVKYGRFRGHSIALNIMCAPVPYVFLSLIRVLDQVTGKFQGAEMARKDHRVGGHASEISMANTDTRSLLSFMM